MAEFRFLHAADIHLDSPLRGLAGQEGGAAERIRSAPREAFERLITFAIDERVDFMIIAGDLYDGDWRDYRTGLFFAAAMGRLNEAEIPVYLLHGNHDAQNEITRRLGLPGNVETFGARRPETFLHDSLPVALHGQSFRQREVTENLALAYPGPVAGAFNIGVLHTALGGMGGHENYAPCALGDLVNRGYDYWALGHVHQGQILRERPHVAFPGNLQGRHIREAGPKGALLVSVEDGVVRAIDAPRFDVVRWDLATVDMSEAADMRAGHDAVGRTLESAVMERAEGRLLACRLRLEGRTPLHERLLVSEDDLLAEARAFALGLGEEVAWVEKVVVATEPPRDGTARVEGIEDIRVILREVAPKPDADLDDRVRSELGEMVRRLPQEAQAEVEDEILRLALEDAHGELVGRVAPYLVARLTVEEED